MPGPGPGLAVVGNICIDHTDTQGVFGAPTLGGAALHVAYAATTAGLPARAISVIGTDLDWIRHDPHLAVLDWSGVATVAGPSATFVLHYDRDGTLNDVESDYGVATTLTAHALATIDTAPPRAVHLCCRRPLEVHTILSRLRRTTTVYSVDFMVSSAATLIQAAAPFLPWARAVFLNAAEYDLLAAFTQPEALAALVVTNGPAPVKILRGGLLTAQMTPPIVDPLDVTGAGDTLTGALLAAWHAGDGDDAALRRAVAAASTHVTTARLPIPPIPSG